MLISMLFFIFQTLLGRVALDFFDKENRFTPLEKILSAIVIGGLLSGFGILLLALLVKSLLLGISIFSVGGLATLIYFHRLWLKKPTVSFSTKDVFWIIPLAIILLCYWMLIASVLSYSPEGHLQSAFISWGDTALHVSMIERMATAQPFLIDNPILANTHLTYSFLINFISAIFYTLDHNIVTAFQFPLLIYGTTGLLLLFVAALRICKSKPFAVLALVLIICGSGLGFLTLAKDLQNNRSNLITFFENPPHDYTHLDNRTSGKVASKETNDNIVWIVPAISFLSHQRSFSVGLCVFSLLLLAILLYGHSPDFWRLGILAGLLPFSHIHSFLALFFLMAALFWFYRKNWGTWLRFAFLTAAVALPQLVYFKSGSHLGTSPIFRPWLGWMACDHSTSWFWCTTAAGTDPNIFWFWLKNFGVIFILWLAAMVILPLIKKQSYVPFVVGSLFLFLVPNLFLFQAWPFDNNKILFYWWVLAILFCVIPLLLLLWQKNWTGKILVVVICFFAVVAGVVDIGARILPPQQVTSYGYADASKDNVTLAAWIAKNTKPNSLFLTDSSVDPTPLFLAGRPVYLGYEGWLWSFGLDYVKLKNAAQKIMRGNLTLACQEKIDYIVTTLPQNFPAQTIVFSQGQTAIIKPPCQP